MRLSYLYARDVNDVDSFCDYIQQMLGTPHITIKDKMILRKMVKETFDQHPTMTWGYLCRIVDWAKDKKRRPARGYTVMSYLNFAWRDHYIPDLPSEWEVSFKKRLDKALQIETDPDWRQRLSMSLGQYQIDALDEWEDQRKDVAIIEDLPVPEQLSLDLKPKDKVNGKRNRKS